MATLSSCATTAPHTPAAAVQTPTATPTGAKQSTKTEWDSSVPAAVSSLTDAASQATLVVKGTAGDSRVELIGDTPFTVTTVTVDEVLSGSGTPATVEVRQFGDEHNTSGDLASLLVSGKQYLLYLQPFELEPGQPLSQFVIVGGTAAWIETSSPDEFGLEAQESELPAVVSEAEVDASTK